jgi:hypothetical protein
MTTAHEDNNRVRARTGGEVAARQTPPVLPSSGELGRAITAIALGNLAHAAGFPTRAAGTGGPAAPRSRRREL